MRRGNLDLGAGLFLRPLLAHDDREPAIAGGRTQGRTAAPGRVLVVEDEHFIAIDVEATLLDAGFAVTGLAASAEEAVALARATRPDLVLMDIRLLGAPDGVDAALEIFRDCGIRCLFATAHHDLATRHRARPAAPLGWIAKPYLASTLVRAVRTALAELDRE